jgi:signal transduction histidine kinase
LPALYSSGHWNGELRFRNRQTGLILQMDCVGFQVKDRQTGEPRYVATVSRDMGERRALEQQLRHAQKFEAIGQLAGGIAHDFNNVIGAILGWARSRPRPTRPWKAISKKSTRNATASRPWSSSSWPSRAAKFSSPAI